MNIKIPKNCQKLAEIELRVLLNPQPITNKLDTFIQRSHTLQLLKYNLHNVLYVRIVSFS